MFIRGVRQPKVPIRERKSDLMKAFVERPYSLHSPNASVARVSGAPTLK